MSRSVYAQKTPDLPRTLLDVDTDAGLIYCVKGSIKQPFYELLSSYRPTRPSERPPQWVIDARSAVLDFSRNPEAGKTRPCIIMRDATEHRGREIPQICLMATFEGNDPKHLPEMYRHFIVPVHPTRYAGAISYNTSPPWRTEPQWIVAIPFLRYYAMIEERWRILPENITFNLSDTELDRLANQCIKLRSAWNAKGKVTMKRWATEVLHSKVDYDRSEPYHPQRTVNRRPSHTQMARDNASTDPSTPVRNAQQRYLHAGYEPRTTGPQATPEKRSPHPSTISHRRSYSSVTSDEYSSIDSGLVLLGETREHINPQTIVKVTPARTHPMLAHGSTRSTVSPSYNPQPNAARPDVATAKPQQNALGLVFGSLAPMDIGSVISAQNQTPVNPLAAARPVQLSEDSTASGMSDVRRGKMPVRLPGEEVQKRPRDATVREPFAGAPARLRTDREPTARHATERDSDWPSLSPSTSPPAEHAPPRKRSKKTLKKKKTNAEGGSTRRQRRKPHAPESSESVLLSNHDSHTLSSVVVTPPDIAPPAGNEPGPSSQQHEIALGDPDVTTVARSLSAAPPSVSDQAQPPSQRKSGNESALDRQALETSAVSPPATDAPPASPQAEPSRRSGSMRTMGRLVEAAKSRTSSLLSRISSRSSSRGSAAGGGYVPITGLGEYVSGPISDSPRRDPRSVSEPMRTHQRLNHSRRERKRSSTYPSWSQLPSP